MVTPVIALGLDSADPEMIEGWIAEGFLPNMKAVYDSGEYARIDNYDWYRAETPWTTFLTGTSPQKTGYWSPIKFDSKEYRTKKINAFDYKKYPPFYASMTDKKVAIFDMPQAPISDDVDGIQVLAWGTHSAQTESISSPPELWQEIVDKHGAHPLLDNDAANCYDVASLEELAEKMALGIERRANACIDLIKKNQWDFFLTIFGEAHVAGHYFWHLSKDHPLYAEFQKREARDLLLDAFKNIDKAIGRILEACPEEMRVVIFSAHGMAKNNMDLPSLVLLPEFLYRWNFPGKKAIAPGKLGAPVKDIPVKEMQTLGMADMLWKQTREAGPIRNTLKKLLPIRLYRKIERRMPEAVYSKPQVIGPFRLRRMGVEEPTQCANWYSALWPEMKAFALPSFSEGYVRINLAGRDANGIVPPEEYDALCEQISKELRDLVDARTGKPMVKKIVKTRSSVDDETDTSPDADLVVVWQEESVASTVDCPKFGRIGPIPYWRTGSHRAGGFFMVSNSETQKQLRSGGHAIDLGATFLDMLDAEKSAANEGESLFVKT